MKYNMEALKGLEANITEQIEICQEQINQMAQASKKFQDKINRYYSILGEIKVTKEVATEAEKRRKDVK